MTKKEINENEPVSDQLNPSGSSKNGDAILKSSQSDISQKACIDQQITENPTKHISQSQCNRTEQHSRQKCANRLLNKAEALVMFIITLIVICMCFSYVYHGNFAMSDRIDNQMQELNQRIELLETQLKLYQENLEEPINITVNIDGQNKDFIYDPNSGEVVEQNPADETTNLNFDTRPFLGVAFYEDNQGKNPIGLRIDYVYQHSPADIAGLKVGDIIMAADGTKISTLEDLNAVLIQHDAMDTIEITLATASDAGVNCITVGVQLTYRGNFVFEDN